MGHKWGDRRTVCKALVGKLEGEGPLGRSGHRWKDTITIFVKELGGQVMDWSILCQERDKRGSVVKTVLGIYSLAVELVACEDRLASGSE